MTDIEKASKVMEYLKANAPEIYAAMRKDFTSGDVHVPTALGNERGSKKISFAEALAASRRPKKAPDAAPPKEIDAESLLKMELPLTITKMDDEQRKVFGWAYISVRDGELVVDKQDDMILPEDLEQAAHEFTLSYRSQGDMHKADEDGDPVQCGRLIGSIVFTPEKYEKAGLCAVDPETGEQLYGWWVEFKVDDDGLWDMHKNGERPEFSIGGTGRRVPVGKQAAGRTIQVVRHGATELNDERVSVDRIRGWKDVPLSQKGIDEAVDLAHKMNANPPDLIVCSDLMRAAETAKIISDITEVPIARITKGLRPWDVGIFAGMLTQEAVPILADYAMNKPNEIVPGGESFDSFKTRYFTALWEILYKYDGLICIVTHHRGERLLTSWVANGCPDDGSIDIDVFNTKGEPTGAIQTLHVQIEPLSAAAE